jgi:hypothetical protein
MAKQTKANVWLKFSSLGIQMGFVIYFGSLAGEWLDNNYPSDFFGYHKLLTLFAVFGATYSLIRQVIKMSNDDEKQKRDL